MAYGISRVSPTDQRALRQVDALLEAEGLPHGANAEIAVCLLMCAADAAELGQRDIATNLTVRTRDLVGEKAAMALLKLIHADDEEADNAS